MIWVEKKGENRYDILSKIEKIIMYKFKRNIPKKKCVDQKKLNKPNIGSLSLLSIKKRHWKYYTFSSLPSHSLHLPSKYVLNKL